MITRAVPRRFPVATFEPVSREGNTKLSNAAAVAATTRETERMYGSLPGSSTAGFAGSRGVASELVASRPLGIMIVLPPGGAVRVSFTPPGWSPPDSPGRGEGHLFAASTSISHGTTNASRTPKKAGGAEGPSVSG
jgi:hypothetical protein